MKPRISLITICVADLEKSLSFYLTNGGERDFVVIMIEVPLSRLYYGGALGIVASWFYTLGAWQVYRAVQPAGGRLASGAFAAFAVMTIGMGSFHVAHAEMGLTGRWALRQRRLRDRVRCRGAP